MTHVLKQLFDATVARCDPNTITAKNIWNQMNMIGYHINSHWGHIKRQDRNL